MELVAQACCRTLVVLLLRQPDPTAASASSSHPNLHLHSKSKVRVVAAMGVCACVVEALHLFPSSVQVAIHTFQNTPALPRPGDEGRGLYVCMYVCMYVPM